MYKILEIILDEEFEVLPWSIKKWAYISKVYIIWIFFGLLTSQWFLFTIMIIVIYIFRNSKSRLSSVIHLTLILAILTNKYFIHFNPIDYASYLYQR